MNGFTCAVMLMLMKYVLRYAFLQGLMHFQINNSCKDDAKFLGSFPSSDPGTQTLMPSFIKLPNSVIMAMTNLDEAAVKKLKASVSSQDNPSIDVACAKRCGLKMP
jgi:hypothetical protein